LGGVDVDVDERSLGLKELAPAVVARSLRLVPIARMVSMLLEERGRRRMASHAEDAERERMILGEDAFRFGRGHHRALERLGELEEQLGPRPWRTPEPAKITFRLLRESASLRDPWRPSRSRSASKRPATSRLPG